MGAPSMTFFCENGHMVLDVPHHSIAEEPTQCPICKSKDIRVELEWGDPDYGPSKVPTEPVRVEKKRRVVRIPVYDVSKLFGKPRDVSMMKKSYADTSAITAEEQAALEASVDKVKSPTAVAKFILGNSERKEVM